MGTRKHDRWNNELHKLKQRIKLKLGASLKSWRVYKIVKKYWKSLPESKRQEIISKAQPAVQQGLQALTSWLIWNVPRYAALAGILVVNGDVPELVHHLFEIREVQNELDQY